MVYTNEHYQRNKEAIARAQRKYYLKNREARLASQKKYDADHREQIKERVRKSKMKIELKSEADDQI